MVRLLTRRGRDLRYFTQDGARELDGVRDGGPGWWLRGGGEPRDPDVAARVLTSTDRSGISGYDLVIAAPRSVSVLLAVDVERAPQVVAAHREGVRAAVAYLEDRAVVVRERRGGETRTRNAAWESVLAYTHGVNRHAEPHLHDHVLVGARPAGSSVVLDVRAIVAHAPTADALYRATLRAEIGRRSSLEVWRSFAGVERVVGVDEGYRALWPGRHRERGVKTLWERGEIAERWHSDLERVELVGAVAVPARSRDRLDEHAFAAALEGRHDVSRRHVVRAWADAATFGARPEAVVGSVDDLYPSLRRGRGVQEPTMGVGPARMVGRIRESGPRPLDRDRLVEWSYRSRSREREGLTR